MWKTIRGLHNAQHEITPDQKREYLRLLLSEGEQSAHAYLEQTDCEGGTFIYQSREEAEIFRRHLEKCCAGTKPEQWFFIPEKRAVAFHLKRNILSSLIFESVKLAVQRADVWRGREKKVSDKKTEENARKATENRK